MATRLVPQDDDGFLELPARYQSLDYVADAHQIVSGPPWVRPQIQLGRFSLPVLAVGKVGLYRCVKGRSPQMAYAKTNCLIVEVGQPTSGAKNHMHGEISVKTDCLTFGIGSPS